MRGRAFGFIVILCATWVTVRIGFILIINRDRHFVPNHNVAAATIAQPLTHIRREWLPSHAAVMTRSAGNPKKGRALTSAKTLIESLATVSKHQMSAVGRNSDDWISDGQAPIHMSSETITSALVDPLKKQGSMLPIKIYAYSFWRQGDATQGVLGNEQYGGSQSALLMTTPLLRHKGKRGVSRLSLVGRATLSHNDLREREWMAGLLWRPSAAFPAQVSLERRFRLDRSDAFVAFVSGGHEGASLPLGFALDGYGQAGFVTGKSGGGFADAQLHALKNMARNEDIALTAGAGAWAGGQSDIMRVDIGPSVRANLQAGTASLQLDASWRFRIAGKARPGDGPTITLSTSF